MKSQTFLEFMNELRSKMLADIFCSSVFFIRLSLPIICINSFRKSWQRIVNPAISCPWWRNYLYRLLWRRFCCPGGSTQKVLILLRFWALLSLRTVFFPLAIRHWRGVEEQQERPWTISPFLFSLRKQEILPLPKIFSRPHVPTGGRLVMHYSWLPPPQTAGIPVYSPMQVGVLIWRRQLKEAVFFSRWLCGKARMEALPQLPCTAELKPWEQFLLISPPVQALWNGINPVSGRTRRRRHSLTLSWRRLIPKPRIQTFSTLLACRFRNRLRHPWVCWGWRPWWFAAAGKPENLVLPAVKGVFACKVQPCRRFF